MKTLTYQKAGVPHLKGDDRYNRKISKMIASTRTTGVLGSKTGFAALFDFKKQGFKDPLLVSSTDGVGTKLEIANLQKKHDTIGIDLVAMCVNDVITMGAKPLFFLDYFATGKFSSKVAGEVLKGVTAGCRDSGCALVGGETAIMPGFYSHGKNGHDSQYDVAGFVVGMVERKKMIDGSKIRSGDVLIGIASSGFHSNGFSLLRKVFSRKKLQGDIGKALLTPTKIYVRPILNLMKSVELRGIVNITGGGFPDNLPRVLPKGLGAVIENGSWPIPKLFQLVQDSGNIAKSEMMRTFNMGIGMVLVVKPAAVKKTQSLLKKMKLSSWCLGEVVKGSGVKFQ